MKRLKDKRALITGGTSGIGLETARVFLAEGARVAITGTNPETLAAARAELRGDVLAIRADAGDVAGQAAITASVREAFGGLDVLFVNAGVGDFRPLEHGTKLASTAPLRSTSKARSFLCNRCCQASPIPRRSY